MGTPRFSCGSRSRRGPGDHRPVTPHSEEMEELKADRDKRYLVLSLAAFAITNVPAGIAVTAAAGSQTVTLMIRFCLPPTTVSPARITTGFDLVTTSMVGTSPDPCSHSSRSPAAAAAVDDGAERVLHLRQPFTRVPDFGETSRNHQMAELIARARPPSGDIWQD